MPMSSTPPLSERAEKMALERARRYQREEFALDRSIREMYRAVFPDFMEELDRYFLDSMVLKTSRSGPEQVWDFFKAATNYVVPELTEAYSEMVDAAEDEAVDLLDEGLTDGFTEGYLLGLWQLENLGVDGVFDAEPPPTSEQAKNLLAVLGIAGITYQNRVNHWTANYKAKASRWIRGAVFTESTREETVTALGHINETLVNRIAALGRDELYRAYNLGQSVAFQQFQGFIAGEIWLTREDERVCPVCKPLHMRITWHEPIKDTHPACRCIKVPIPVDNAGRLTDPGGRYIEYSTFRKAFLNRQ